MPLPIAETMRKALRATVDRLERPARTIDDTVTRTTGLRMAPDTGAAARAPGLIVGAVAGALGVWGGFSLLTTFASIGLITAGANGALMTLRVAAGLTLSAAMAVGGAAGLAGDTRGAPVLWSAIWGLLIVGFAGIGVQLVLQLPQTGFAYLAAAIAGEIGVFLRVMVLPLVALALLWLRAPERKTPAS